MKNDHVLIKMTQERIAEDTDLIARDDPNQNIDKYPPYNWVKRALFIAFPGSLEEADQNAMTPEQDDSFPGRQEL
jgi:hypothetical protein